VTPCQKKITVLCFDVFHHFSGKLFCRQFLQPNAIQINALQISNRLMAEYLKTSEILKSICSNPAE